MLLSGLLSFAPGLLGTLFGGDPQKQQREMIQRLLSPQYQQQLTNQFYQQALGSPAYSQAQGTIAAGANKTAGNLGQELGARGIGTSGTGAILSSLLPSIVGSQQAGLRTSAYGGAQNQALQNIQSQIQNIQGTSGPSQNRQLFAGGLDAFLPYLQQFLKRGGMGTGGGLPTQSLLGASNYTQQPMSLRG